MYMIWSNNSWYTLIFIYGHKCAVLRVQDKRVLALLPYNTGIIIENVDDNYCGNYVI